MPLIATCFVYPPIPVRSFDWQAHYDDDEPNDEGQMNVGHGCTEQEAIDDLLTNHPPACVDCGGRGGIFPGIECATCEGSGERERDDALDPVVIKRSGVASAHSPDDPTDASPSAPVSLNQT